MWLCSRDTSKECEGYRDCTVCTLEKIKTEINNLTFYCCEVNPRSVIDEILEIIDKYEERR